MSGKCQGKTKFSPGQRKVRNFEKMSGNFGHLTHVKELSGNFVMPYQGIVRKVCHDIISRSHDKGSSWVKFM